MRYDLIFIIAVLLAQYFMGAPAWAIVGFCSVMIFVWLAMSALMLAIKGVNFDKELEELRNRFKKK